MYGIPITRLIQYGCIAVFLAWIVYLNVHVKDLELDNKLLSVQNQGYESLLDERHREYVKQQEAVGELSKQLIVVHQQGEERVRKILSGLQPKDCPSSVQYLRDEASNISFDVK